MQFVDDTMKIIKSCSTFLTVKHLMTECRSYTESRTITKLPERLLKSLFHNRPLIRGTTEFMIKFSE